MPGEVCRVGWQNFAGHLRRLRCPSATRARMRLCLVNGCPSCSAKPKTCSLPPQACKLTPIAGRSRQTPVNRRDASRLRALVAKPTATGLGSRLAVAYLQRRGINPGPLLKQAGLSATALARGNRIPVTSQIEFLRLVSNAVADDWIGLTLAADFDLREMGMLYYVAASSQRLGHALHRLERYARLGNEAVVVRIGKGPVCRVGLSYTGV